jgi:hypothetical protein
VPSSLITVQPMNGGVVCGVGSRVDKRKAKCKNCVASTGSSS